MAKIINILEKDIKKLPAYVCSFLTLLYVIYYLIYNKINIANFETMAILTGTMFLIPRLPLGDDEDFSIKENPIGYVAMILLTILIINDIVYTNIDSHFLSLICTFIMTLFGLNKINKTTNIFSFVDIFNRLKKNKGDIVDNIIERVKEVKKEESESKEEIKEKPKEEIKPKKEIIDVKELIVDSFEDEPVVTNKKLTLVEVAKKYLGLKEVPGVESNPIILKWAKSIGLVWYKNDDIAWCAVAANAIAKEAGLEHKTNNALAKGMLELGESISIDEAYQDPTNVIGVWHRGSSSQHIAGHVAILVKLNSKKDIGLFYGGNQSNSFSSANFSISDWRFIGFKRLNYV